VIAKIIRDDERCPKNLQTDRGKEFYNANVQKLLKKFGINHYSTYSVMSATSADSTQAIMQSITRTAFHNKKVPGLMKDENNDAIMTEFVGLRAKMYALRIDGKKDTKKVKGVIKNIVVKSITFDDYTQTCRNF